MVMIRTDVCVLPVPGGPCTIVSRLAMALAMASFCASDVFGIWLASAFASPKNSVFTPGTSWSASANVFCFRSSFSRASFASLVSSSAFGLKSSAVSGTTSCSLLPSVKAAGASGSSPVAALGCASSAFFSPSIPSMSSMPSIQPSTISSSSFLQFWPSSPASSSHAFPSSTSSSLFSSSSLSSFLSWPRLAMSAANWSLSAAKPSPPSTARST
mmetsp:Transcript_29690/g.81287  ORF Transcript_29690/g.81287 Transcript_29690/m.81287 type:complete len:214 (+) Transcript_29690:2019-2660(+)